MAGNESQDVADDFWATHQRPRTRDGLRGIVQGLGHSWIHWTNQVLGTPWGDWARSFPDEASAVVAALAKWEEEGK